MKLIESRQTILVKVGRDHRSDRTLPLVLDPVDQFGEVAPLVGVSKTIASPSLITIMPLQGTLPKLSVSRKEGVLVYPIRNLLNQ